MKPKDSEEANPREGLVSSVGAMSSSGHYYSASLNSPGSVLHYGDKGDVVNGGPHRGDHINSSRCTSGDTSGLYHGVMLASECMNILTELTLPCTC